MRILWGLWSFGGVGGFWVLRGCKGFMGVYGGILDKGRSGKGMGRIGYGVFWRFRGVKSRVFEEFRV